MIESVEGDEGGSTGSCSVVLATLAQRGLRHLLGGALPDSYIEVVVCVEHVGNGLTEFLPLGWQVVSLSTPPSTVTYYYILFANG